MEANGNAETSELRTRESNFVRIWLSTKITRQHITETGSQRQARTGQGSGRVLEMKEIKKSTDRTTERPTGATDCQGRQADKSENIEIRNKEIYEFAMA